MLRLGPVFTSTSRRYIIESGKTSSILGNNNNKTKPFRGVNVNLPPPFLLVIPK